MAMSHFILRQPKAKSVCINLKTRNTEKPFCSKLAAFFRNNVRILEKLALEMYARGLSTKDIEDALMKLREI